MGSTLASSFTAFTTYLVLKIPSVSLSFRRLDLCLQCSVDRLAAHLNLGPQGSTLIRRNQPVRECLPLPLLSQSSSSTWQLGSSHRNLARALQDRKHLSRCSSGSVYIESDDSSRVSAVVILRPKERQRDPSTHSPPLEVARRYAANH